MAARRTSLPQVRVSRKGSYDPIEKTARAIDKAEESVCAVVYKFNKKRILKALREALHDGVDVRLLVDEWQVTGKVESLVRRARSAGAKVKYWKHGKLHAKFTIVDRSLVLSGSYNWTKSASNKNTELVLSFEEPKTVKAFLRRFRDMWSRGTPLE